LRIADLQVGQTTFRVAAGAGIEAGTVLNITDGTKKEDRVVDVAFRFNDGSVAVTLSKGLTNSYSLKSTDPDITVSSYEFDLAISNGVINETFSTLSMDPRHSRYFARAAQSQLVTATPPVSPDTPSTQTPPANRPAPLTATSLANGANDDLNATGVNEYNAGLQALETIDDVNMVLCPDRTDGQGVQLAVVAHCEKMADRFAILDAAYGVQPDVTLNSPLATQRAFLQSARGYAAVYYPWIEILDPSSRTGTDTLFIPPSGHIAGIYARSDEQRGVHKAPANELITSAIGLSQVVDGTTQGELNDAGVNVIRLFAGQARPTVWGARTTCPPQETPWRYVNVRRLFLFVEKSIQEGTRWAVFEPNDLSLWKKLNRTLVEFLTRVWRSGALFGATAAQAFYVKIDEENNPPATRALGQVIIEIGLAPVRPAEFVVVRIGMWDGGSNVSEQ
jgi:phage tail sheath protein FI